MSPYDIGVIHLGLAESDAALQWLDRAYAERDHQMTFLRVDPRLDGVRASPQFISLMKMMGFSSAAGTKDV